MACHDCVKWSNRVKMYGPPESMLTQGPNLGQPWPLSHCVQTDNGGLVRRGLLHMWPVRGYKQEGIICSQNPINRRALSAVWTLKHGAFSKPFWPADMDIMVCILSGPYIIFDCGGKIKGNFIQFILGWELITRSFLSFLPCTTKYELA